MHIESLLNSWDDFKLNFPVKFNHYECVFRDGNGKLRSRKGVGKNFEKNCTDYISKGILKDLVSLAIYDEDKTSNPWKDMSERQFGLYVDNDTIPPNNISFICTCYFKFSKELSIDDVEKLWRIMHKYGDFECMISFCVEEEKNPEFFMRGMQACPIEISAENFYSAEEKLMVNKIHDIDLLCDNDLSSVFPLCILSNHSKMSIDSQAYDEVFNIDTALLFHKTLLPYTSI